MIDWLTLVRKKTKRALPVCRQRTTLQVEALERRDCPSAPQITAFTATIQTGNTVLLSGTVIDNNPTAALVCFGGAASGSVTPDASGHFQLQENLSQMGTITATVQDPGGSMSNTAQATATNPGTSPSQSAPQAPPTIVNFQAIDNGSNSWTVTGQVQGQDVAGLIVTLRGIPSLDSSNASAVVQADGSFSYTFTVQPGQGGEVTAQCTGWWGQVSNEATAFVWS